MKRLHAGTLLFFLAFFGMTSFGQKIRVQEGSRDVLKNESSVNIEFTYDNLGVGKYSKEEEYVNAKKEELNKKEAGKGDTWAKKWGDEKETRFEPDFKDLFEKTSKMTLAKDAKYTLIFHTTFIEPGFNIAIHRKNAAVDAEVLIVETANKTRIVTKLTIEKAPGNAFFGNDFDTGERVAQAYAKAGKELGQYLK